MVILLYYFLPYLILSILVSYCTRRAHKLRTYWVYPFVDSDSLKTSLGGETNDNRWELGLDRRVDVQMQN